MPYECINNPKILNEYLNYPIFLIYFEDFFNCHYISTTKMCVCNFLNYFFNSFIAPDLIIIENSGWGNRMYLFIMENFLLQVDLLKNSFYTYG